MFSILYIPNLNNIFKEYIIIAKQSSAPIFNQIIVILIPAIDLIVLGRYSELDLAALSTSIAILTVVMIAIVGFFSSLNPIISHFSGSNESSKIIQTLYSSVTLGFLVYLISFIVIILIYNNLDYIGINLQIIPSVKIYLYYIMFGLFAFIGFQIFRFFNQALLQSKRVSKCYIFALPIKLILNLVFINGIIFDDVSGIAGCSISTVITWIIMLAMIIYLSRSDISMFIDKHNKYSFTSNFNLQSYKEIISLGIPISISSCIEALMLSIIAIHINNYSISAISGNQIVMNLATLLFMIPLGASISITTRISYLKGKEDYFQLGIAIKSSFLFTLTLAVINLFVLLYIGKYFVTVYTSSNSILLVTISLLSIAAVIQIPDSIQLASFAILRGFKKTRSNVWVYVFSFLLVSILSGNYFAVHLDLKYQGYWYGMLVGHLSAMVMGLYLLKLNGKRFKLINEPLRDFK